MSGAYYTRPQYTQNTAGASPEERGDMGEDNREDRILEGLLGRIAAALEDIAQKLGVLVNLNEPRSLQVNFGQPTKKEKQ